MSQIESLHLSQSQIIYIIHDIRKFWIKSPLRNAKKLINLMLFETWVRTSNDNEIGEIFHAIIKFIDMLRYESSLNSGEIGMKELNHVKRSFAKEMFG